MSARSCANWLDELHRELGVTSLFVTHDQEEALELANEVVVMNHGKVEQVGAADQIYNQPATPFVAAFVGSSNVLHGTVWERYVHFGRSAVAGAHNIPDGREAVAYIRPHDIELTTTPGAMSFPISVERRTDMGWMAKLHLRLEDGQPLVAQLPNEEIQGVGPGQRLYANLRNPKVFSDDRVEARFRRGHRTGAPGEAVRRTPTTRPKAPSSRRPGKRDSARRAPVRI